MHKRFNIDDLEYFLHINQSGDIWLDLEGGVTRKGSAWRSPCADLFWDEPNFEDVDLGINGLTVFIKVKNILLQHVFGMKPGRLGFSASTGRKIPIYRWMAHRLARQLRNYTLVEFPEGAFNFYRLANTAFANGGVWEGIE